MPNDGRSILGRALLILGRIVLAIVFLVAAYLKIKPLAGMAWSAAALRTSLAMFAMQVDSYQILSAAQVNLVAHALPFVELALGLWLLSGIALRFSSLLTMLLLAGFFTLMVHSFALHQEISCGCFGPGSEPIGPKSLARDGALLAVGIAVTVGAFLVHRHRGEVNG